MDEPQPLWRQDPETNQIERASSYSPELAGRIVERVRSGDTLATIAMAIGIRQRSIQEWAVTFPDFGDALQAARAAYAATSPTPPFTPRGQLTPDVEATIIEASRLGVPRTSIAGLVGVSEATMRQWLSEASDLFQPELYRKVELARAEAVQMRLAIIEQAAMRGVWQAAAWSLEREYPERFALNQARQQAQIPPPTPELPSDRSAMEAAAMLVNEFRERVRNARDVTPPEDQ